MFSVRVSVRFFARFSARVFALCVVVAVGVCRAFIGLILVIQSVGRIFTVVLQSCCSLVAVLSQVCYCRVTVTHRVTGVLLSHYRPPSCYRCVVVVLPLCYRPIALSLCYCRVTVALLSRYCRVTVVLLSRYCRVIVALLSCYRCVTVVLSSCYRRVIVVVVVVPLRFCSSCRFCDVSSVVSSGSFLFLFLCPLCTRFVGIVALNARKTVSVQCETVDQGEQDVRRVIKVRFGCFVADVYGAKEVKVFQELTA